MKSSITNTPHTGMIIIARFPRGLRQVMLPLKNNYRNTKLKIVFTFIVLFLAINLAFPQNLEDTESKSTVRVSAFDGVFAFGFVNGGGFTNFTGPNINMTYGHHKYILSALPSLRYKRDRSEPRNAFVTPNLGVGFTYSYKLFAIQIPLYYNPKTATENGEWHVGIGLGMRLNYL